MRLPEEAPAGIVVSKGSSPPSPLDTAAVVAELRAEPETVAPEEIGKPRASVLVVEDNREMSRFLVETLSAIYRVERAFDGKAGLARALELRPDLILTDVMMPEMSGDELVRALRSHPALNETPIVLLTAKADEALRVRLLREGAQDYLMKPFSTEELLARLENLVSKKRAEERTRALNQQLESVARASMAVSEAVADLPETSVNAVLKTIALHAQALTNAQYAAIGIGTDPGKEMDPWLFLGLSDEEAARIGPPPHPVGTLGAVALGGKVMRIADLRQHPAYRGVPPHHPEMTSLLGVPIRHRGQSVGNLYLANKQGAAEFTEHDVHVVEMLAARAGVAIETARLYRTEGTERAWLQMVVDQMPEGVLLMDAQGRVTIRSRAILALSCGDTGQHDPFGNPVLLDMRLPTGEAVSAAEHPNVLALLSGEATVGREFLLRQTDGRLAPVLVSAARIRGRGDTVAGAAMIVQDISTLKELERMKEEWASIVAHDLRQPLSVITMATELLSMTRETATEGDRKTIERLRTAVARLSRMLDDLSDVSRIEARRLSLQRRAVRLPELLRDIIEPVPDFASRCALHIEPEADPPVLVDPDRVHQVLHNLLSNAVKYGTPGTPIPVRVERHGDWVEVTVTNSGPGLAEHELLSIFQRFERTRRARAGRAPGLGVGLYICKGLIEAHGGHIWADSVQGESTSFHFTLPLAPGKDLGPLPSNHPASPSPETTP